MSQKYELGGNSLGEFGRDHTEEEWQAVKAAQQYWETVVPKVTAEREEEYWERRVRNTVDSGPLGTGAAVRTFDTGATRDSDEGKLDFEGFLSPLVLHRFAQYMNEHRVQADGNLRASDNWTKGMPRREYLKSLWRHFMDAWFIMRGMAYLAVERDLEKVLCAVLFNVQGLLHEVLVGRHVGAPEGVDILVADLTPTADRPFPEQLCRD